MHSLFGGVHRHGRRIFTAAFTLSFLLSAGCGRVSFNFNNNKDEEHFHQQDGPYKGEDPVRVETDAFAYKTRGYYNSSNFRALEETIADVRTGPEPLFRDGTWKVARFYGCLECRDSESEGMWQLHQRIHEGWEKAYPQSSAARIAHADFFVSYAWHARGSGYSNTVSAEGWRLFEERLKTAQAILTQAKSMQPRDPTWYSVQMTIALGQSWNRADYGRVYNEAKQFSPQFHNYDSSLAHYLLPRWFGQPGDWEKAAAAEIRRPDGLGVEGYARTVSGLAGYYDNIFRETQASWPNTKAGYEILRKKYPDSLAITSGYCRLACVAEDRPLARQLFQQLNGYVDSAWGKPDYYRKCHDWAMAGQ